jgi:hypothetical protein
MQQAASRVRDAASNVCTASPLLDRSRRKRLRSKGRPSSRQTEVCRSPSGRQPMRNCFPLNRSKLRLNSRRSKLRPCIAAFAAAHAPKRVLRVPAANLAICGVPARRALPGPVRRVRSSSLTAAPAPVRRMKAQDRSSSFSASPLSPPCPGNIASNVSTATRFGGADSAGLPGCRQPGSPSPLSPACAGCRSSAAYAAEHLAFSCLTLRFVRNPPAAGLATSLLP